MSWNGRAMPWVQSAGPRTEDSGTFDKDPVPSMIAWFMRNQATPSPIGGGALAALRDPALDSLAGGRIATVRRWIVNAVAQTK